MMNINLSSILENVVLAYLVLAFIKIALCVSNVGVAAEVMHRKLGAHPRLFYFGTTLVVTAVVTFLRVPHALKEEGFRFFLVYSNRKVIKDVLAGI